MKLTAKILVGAAALAFVTLSTGSLQAQVTNIIAISFTATMQNPDATDNGIVTTTPAPSKLSVTTATILQWLVADEHAAGHYAGTAFPSGAKLVAVSRPAKGLDFQVLDKKDNFLVDASNVLTLTSSGPYPVDVFTGKSYDSLGLPAPTITDQQVYSLNYNDSAILDLFRLAFTGLVKSITTDTTPNTTTGKYKQTESHTLSSGQGNGIYIGDELVIAGASFKASGSAELVE